MLFDYDSVDWRFVARIMDENSVRVSRTRAGISDTSTSAGKRKLLLEGDRLKERSAANEEQMQRLIFEMRHVEAPKNAARVLDLVWQIADTVNAGLVRPDNRLRQWPSYAELPAVDGRPARRAARRAPAELCEAMDQFAELIVFRWKELSADPVPLASWAAWELNGGTLHPFYDGCGRISRAFEAMLLLQGSSLLPLYEDRDTYFIHGHRGEQAIATYARARIGACATWLGA